MGLKLRGTSIENNRIFYILIVLACMNFYEEGALITLILGLYFLWKSHFKFETDISLVSMLVVTGCIIITSVIYNRAYVECLKAFNFVLLYIVGRRGYTLAEDKEVFIKRTLFAVFFGFFIQLILQYGYNFGKTYERARTMYSIWTQQAIAVTLIGLLSAAIIGYSFYGIFLCKKKLVKVLSISAMVLTVIVNLASATRTPIYLMFVSFIVMAIIYFSDSSTTNSRGKIRMLGVLLVLVIGLFVAFEMNVFNLKTYVEASALLGRVSYAGIRTGRTTLFTQYNRLMPEYLWGGGHMRAIIGRSAHNYLQESYDLYGVFSFLALIVFTFHMIGNFVKLLKIKGKRDYHFLLVSMGIALFVQCCLEPVMTGYPVALWVLIMIDGMTTSFLRSGQVFLESSPVMQGESVY
jgi:hypothetical protein